MFGDEVVQLPSDLEAADDDQPATSAEGVEEGVGDRLNRVVAEVLPEEEEQEAAKQREELDAIPPAERLALAAICFAGASTE